MGEVYRAKDTKLGRDVALKALTEEFFQDQGRVARFEREARSLAALNHPNIAVIHSFEEIAGRHVLVMELVEGNTLRLAFPAELLPAKRLLEIGVQIAEGLAKAHAAGIVHRDLKPENVIVSRDGWVKILDFGLAKLAEPTSQGLSGMATASGTVPGMVMGTVGYMSPEQASGKPADFRADQFSFGTILYELATGQRAFQRDSTAETLVAVIREEPEPIAKLNPRLPAPLRWIVERCLAKDADGRYASTRDLARDLATLRDHLSEAVSGETAAAETGVAPAEELPTFQRLSFRRGTILSARFAPDGRTVVYGAAWEGEPCRLFSTRPESPESSALTLPDAEILSISRTGQMAISLERRWAGRFIWSGTLAQVPLSGGAPRELTIQDVFADGRILMTSDNGKVGVIGRPPGSDRDRDLSLLDWSLVRDLSPDGKQLLFDETGEGGGARHALYMRRTDGSPAVQLGVGWAGSFSPDGRWVATTGHAPGGRAITLLPVKAGEPQTLPRHDLAIHRTWGLPDGKRLLVAANAPGEGLRLFVQGLDGATPRPITPQGIAIGFFPISPDGRIVVGQGADGHFYGYPLEGGDPEYVPGLVAEDRPIRFSTDGRALYAYRRGELPARVIRLDLATGEKKTSHELMPADPAGVVEVVSVVLTPDVSSYAYSYHRILSDLFLVEGLE